MSVGVTHEGSPSLSLSSFLISFFLPSFSSIQLVAAPLVILSALPKSEPLVREIDSIN
jgi:hypothetical protein